MAMTGEVNWIYDSGDTLTAQDLSDRYGHKLPLLVVVVNGFYANREEMCFGTGQVLRLQELRQQRRALVHDDQKKTLSVPLDYAHRFHVGHDTTTAMTIGEICERHKLPVKIRFAEPNMRFDCGPDYGTRTFNTLRIIREHEEDYFVANFAMQGQLLDGVFSIPMYLKAVRFSVITGARGRGQSDGGRGLMQALLHTQARGLDFSVKHGDTEMVQLSEKPIKATDNIYQNIETNIYINVHQQQRRRQQQQQPTAQKTTTTTTTSTTRQTQQDRDSEIQRQQRRPPPPLPGEDNSQGEAAVACSQYKNLQDMTQPYVNLGQLRESMSSHAPEGEAENYEVTCSPGHAQTSPDALYYDPDRDEPTETDAGVYEPVNMNSVRKKTANLYTSLEPAQPSPALAPASKPTTTSKPSMASELQKALQERQERVRAAEAAGGGGGAGGGEGQEKGKKGGSSSSQGPSLPGHRRGSSGRQDPSVLPAHEEAQQPQPSWVAKKLKPVTAAKLTMSPHSDSTTSNDDVADAATARAGAGAGGGGGGGGREGGRGGGRGAGEGGGGSKTATLPSQAATAAAQALAVASKPKPTKPKPQIGSAKPAVTTAKPAVVGQKSRQQQQQQPQLPPPPLQQQQQPNSGTASKGSAVPHARRAGSSSGRGKDPAAPAKESAAKTTPADFPSAEQGAVARAARKLSAGGANDDDREDDDNTPKELQKPPPLDRSGLQQIPPARSPVVNNNSSNNNNTNKDEDERIYVNDIVAVIAPTQSSSSPASSSSSSGSGGKVVGKVRGGGQGHVQGQVTVSDKKRSGSEQPHSSLPLDQPLDLWTMDDVTQLLTSLNLARHSADFREAQVDGKLLQQLTSDMLKEEFGLGGIAVMKLTNFVSTGHLPK